MLESNFFVVWLMEKSKEPNDDVEEWEKWEVAIEKDCWSWSMFFVHEACPWGAWSTITHVIHFFFEVMVVWHADGWKFHFSDESSLSLFIALSWVMPHTRISKSEQSRRSSMSTVHFFYAIASAPNEWITQFDEHFVQLTDSRIRLILFFRLESNLRLETNKWKWYFLTSGNKVVNWSNSKLLNSFFARPNLLLKTKWATSSDHRWDVINIHPPMLARWKHYQTTRDISEVACFFREGKDVLKAAKQPKVQKTKMRLNCKPQANHTRHLKNIFSTHIL